MDRKQELYNLIQLRDKQRQKNIQKRAIKTITFFAIVFMILFYAFDKIISVKSILEYAMVSIVCSGIYFFVNAIIFSQLSDASRNEQDLIDCLKKEYDKLD